MEGIKMKIESGEKTPAEKKLEEIAGEYRTLLRDYLHMGRSLLDRRDFDLLFSHEKEEILSESKPIDGGAIDFWKLKNKYGDTKKFSYPEATPSDLIHATTWNRLVKAASGEMKLLRATKAEFGEGIWFIKKKNSGPVDDDLRYGRGKAQLKEDFAVAVRIPQSLVEYLKAKEKKANRKIVIENAGNLGGEGFISAAENQGLPLLFLEYGLPDGKWHTLLDILGTPDVRRRIEEKKSAN